jgi:hypothetical protein
MERIIEDVISKAMAKKISWIMAAEIAGMSVRNMQRKRAEYRFRIPGGTTGRKARTAVKHER